MSKVRVLALIVTIFVASVLNTFPITVALGEWYAENAIFALAAMLGLSTYALYTALGVRLRRPADWCVLLVQTRGQRGGRVEDLYLPKTSSALILQDLRHSPIG